MRPTRFLLCALVALVAATTTARSENVVREPFQRELELIYIFEGDTPEFVFKLGQAGFKSVASLKEHLKTWPRGSELRWAPGCKRLGGEPLLSSDKEMEEFRGFLKEHGIEFVLVPSG